ncbi:RNA polymerase sigma-70 factor (ECF subfamily) [Paenibacillus mucilaginosus]|uniref:RNA polymerase sigma factor n=1 Tax=Paenibacillus mucilaginosus TaxID=61624 RepID=UPI003D1EAF39
MEEESVDGLLKRVLEGETDAFAVVIRAYQQRIHAYCYWMLGDREESEDAVQEIMFKAYRSLHAYRYDHSFASWLYAIAANHCRSLLRRRHRWSLLMPLLGNRSEERSAEAVYGSSERNQLERLQGLSVKEKEVLILRVFEDRSFEEIGSILGLRPAAARKRFERLRNKLKEQWEQKEETAHGRRFEYQ